MNGEEKLKNFRKIMAERGYDAYIIPHGDQHNNEYIAEADERIKFISNFSGSNGLGLVTKDIALMWTDSRYFIQIEKELYPGWKMQKMYIDPGASDYILKNLPNNSKIAMDYSLFSEAQITNIVYKLKNYELFDDNENLIDTIWANSKPKYSSNKIIILPEKFSGCSVLEKYKMLQNKLKELLENKGENYDKNQKYRLLISRLDDICWLLNLRGNDIPYNPVFFSYALFYFSEKECHLNLYMDKNKTTEEILTYFKQNNINLFDYNDIYKDLITTENIITIIDNISTNYRMSLQILKNLKDKVKINDIDCIEHLKYVKNPIEISGFRNANIKDSVSLIKFFAWLEEEILIKKNIINEYEIGIKNKQFREDQQYFMGESFAPICACGSNAAIVHYEQNENLHSDMNINKLILCDTGAQYMDGTTDITRTVHFGNPTNKEKEMYTRVLLGNLSLERLIFGKGNKLLDLDAVPRSFLNMKGVDYGHSTSHGVGHFLNVHEGPRRQPLKVGNIITNEPGYYEKDSFGIRIENELLVVEKGKNMGFENLTFVPYERNLIDMELVSNDFKKYIDDFHKKVYEIIAPKLENDKRALDYLKRKTEPL